MSKSTKIIILILLLIVLIGLIFIFGNSVYQKGIGPIDKENTDVIMVSIPEGSSGYDILSILSERGLLNNTNLGKVFLKLNKFDNLQAGTYEFNKSLSLKDMFSAINTVDSEYLTSDLLFTVYEGSRIPQVAEDLEAQFGIPQDEFLDLWSNKEYLNSLIDKYEWITDDILNSDIYYPLEGYLYPDTYYAKYDASVEDITNILLNQMDKVLSERADKIKSSGYSYHDLLTLASVVQDESGSFDDMPMIAGVFINRLNIPMRLESCSTCLYGIQKRHLNVTYAEMDQYTPYNTYAKDGLPVGPICTFSYHAIDGVLDYAKHDYLFFFACSDRTVLYAKTYDEHIKNANENAWF